MKPQPQTLLIDTGATKTDFRLLHEKKMVFEYQNRGINISYCTDDEVLMVIGEFYAALPEFARESSISEVFYYGAGAGNPHHAGRLKTLLAIFFPDAEIEVASDLLATCRALSGTAPGWNAILGTGSASCYYDGVDIVTVAPSLGYLLGDEGSGTHLGKIFLAAYLSKELPQNIAQLFEEEYSLNAALVMENLYRKEHPNRFISSLVPFLLKHIKDPYVHNFCVAAFSQFIEKQLKFINPYLLEKKINISGSVAFLFKELVEESAKMHGVVVEKVIKSPMDELMKYH